MNQLFLAVLSLRCISTEYAQNVKENVLKMTQNVPDICTNVVEHYADLTNI